MSPEAQVIAQYGAVGISLVVLGVLFWLVRTFFDYLEKRHVESSQERKNLFDMIEVARKTTLDERTKFFGMIEQIEAKHEQKHEEFSQQASVTLEQHRQILYFLERLNGKKT